jgi:hypothetical protein
MLVLTAILLGAGIVYWTHLPPSLWTGGALRCVYWDPACSLAVGTYALTFVTSAAFLAAFYAAWLALGNLRLEQSQILVEHVGVPTEIERYAAELYFEPGNLTDSVAIDREELESQSFQFQSIGRMAILDASLNLTVKSEKGTHTIADRLVDLGCVAAGAYVYVRLWVRRDALPLAVTWTVAKLNDQRSARAFEFRPRAGGVTALQASVKRVRSLTPEQSPGAAKEDAPRSRTQQLALTALKAVYEASAAWIARPR